MIVRKKLIVLPHSLFPGVESRHTNNTSEMVCYCLNTVELGIDPIVEAIVKNPESIVHANSEYKSFLSTDCTLVSTDAQKKNTNKFIISRTECNVVKTISVKNLIESGSLLPKGIIDMLHNALMFDLIDSKDLVYFPQQRWKQTPTWVSNINVPNINLHHNAYISSLEELMLDIESVMYYSNNAVLTDESFAKLKMMLENNQDVSLAVGMINNINPTKSFVELLVLHNYIPAAYRNKNKKKVLKALHAIYTIPFLEKDISLSNIEVFCKMNAFNLSLEKQEFIADNYTNSNMETSSIFNLKIKIKS